MGKYIYFFTESNFFTHSSSIKPQEPVKKANETSVY